MFRAYDLKTNQYVSIGEVITDFRGTEYVFKGITRKGTRVNVFDPRAQFEREFFPSVFDLAIDLFDSLELKD